MALLKQQHEYPGAERAIGRALVRAQRGTAADRSLSDVGGAAQLSTASPQPVYTISPAELADGLHSLDATARQVGWQYLLVRGDGETPVGSAEVRGDDVGGAAKVTGVSFDPAAEATDAAISVAEQLARDSDYEARVLRISSLRVRALWLKPIGQDGREDLFIPVEPTHPPFEANRPYPAREFLEALRGRAAEALEDARSSAKALADTDTDVGG